jgi:hypothetical protein
MKYARRNARRAGLLKSRRSLKVNNMRRKALFAERLEERSLLAGDVFSGYWNAARPTDVNNDGSTAAIDALLVINELNRNGARQLPQLIGAAGESGGSGPSAYLDVNNDGHISAIDVLRVFNVLNAGEGVGPGNASIAWENRTAGEDRGPATTSPIQAGATFTITPNPYGQAGDFIVVDNQGEDADPDNGQFLISGAVPGTYTITQTAVPANFVPDFDPTRQVVVGDAEDVVVGVMGADNDDYDSTNNVFTDESDFHTLTTLMRYELHVVAPGAPLFEPDGAGGTRLIDQTPTLHNVTIGQEYDVVVTARDLRTGGSANGVFAGFIDLNFDETVTTLQAWEIHRVRIGPFDTTNTPASASGNFQLSIPFPGGTETTGNITYSSNTAILANNIRVALEGLASIDNDPDGAGPQTSDVEVLFDTSSDATQQIFNVRFLNNFFGNDVPNMTVTSNLTGPSNPAVTVTHDGDLVGGPEGGPAGFAVRRAIQVPPGQQSIVGVASIKDGVGGYFPTAPSGFRTPSATGLDKIDEAGGIGTQGGTPADPYPNTPTNPEIAAGIFIAPPRELIRGRFIANAEGQVVFTADDLDMIRPAHDTLLHTRDFQLFRPEVSFGAGVTVSVSGGPFSANDDTVTDAVEDVPRLIDVLANDTTQNATDVKQVTGVTQPAAGGTVTFTPTGVTLTPAQNFNGVVTFTYTGKNNTVDPSGAQADTATVTVTINAVNDAPTITNPGAQTVGEAGGTLDVTLQGITPGGGADEATQTVSVSATSSAPGTVTASVGAGNVLTLTGGTAGNAVVTLTAVDNGTPTAATTTVTFNVVVSQVNDPPVLTVPGGQSTDTGVALVLSTANGNAISVADPDAAAANIIVTLSVNTGGLLSVPAGSPPTIGGNNSANLTLTGTVAQINAKLGNGVTFTPNAGFDGSVTLTVNANDQGNTGAGGAKSDQETITIDVRPPAPRPIADNDSYNATEDTPLSVPAATGVLDGDTEAPGQNRGPLTVAGTTPTTPATITVSGGTVVLRNDGSFDYNPTLNFNGTTSFTYRAAAGDGTPSLPAIVTLSVAAQPDAPNAVDDAVDASKNNPKVITVLDNDSDPDGDNLTITAVTQPAVGGTVAIDPSGRSVTFTPTADFTSPPDVTFTYTVSDGTLTDTATVTVTVRDFVPKTVSGQVYLDSNNNGVIDANERLLAGVSVTISGTGLTGPVNTTVQTDASGRYSFPNIAPGSYTVTEIQPAFLLDGQDTENTLQATISGNDRFSLTLSETDLADTVAGLNFGERGVDVAHPEWINTAGLLAELFSTSSSDGMIIMTETDGDSLWSWSLNNWGAYNCEIFINTSDWTFIEMSVNGGTRFRIYQDPRNNTVLPNHSTGPRFRVLGIGTNGRYMIRLDGTAEHFGLLPGGVNQVTAAPVPQAEGEGTADREFTEAADAIHREQAWA